MTPLLQRRVPARRGNERPPGQDGPRLHHHGLQRRDRRDDARDDMPVDVAVAQVACCVERESQTIRADLFEQGETLCKDVVHTIRIDQVGQNFVSQDCSPSGVSSAALGLREISQIGSERRVKVGGVQS